MWSSNLMKQDIVHAIYKESEPSLKNMALRQIVVDTGEDVIVTIKLESEELPQDMPTKWKEKNYNAMQFVFLFIGVEFISSLPSSFNYDEVEMQFENAGNEKMVKLLDNAGKSFEFKTKWIDVQSLNGYLKE